MTDSGPVSQPIHPLSAREAGLPPDDALYGGVPQHLDDPLRKWTQKFLGTFDLAENVALRLRITSFGLYRDGQPDLRGIPGLTLLDVIDDSLKLSSGRLSYEADNDREDDDDGGDWWPPNSATRAVIRLQEILTHGGSAYTVLWGTHAVPTQLVRRVDPTVEKAALHAIANAGPSAGELLAKAWTHTYGMQPQPDAAYGFAVKAVEALACPLTTTEKTNPRTHSLGGAIRELGGKDARDRWSWRFVLAGADDNDSPEPVVAMMRRLWEGQVSRHAGGPHNRPQKQGEAEAAAHLAAALVHLLSTDALTHRQTVTGALKDSS